MIEGPPLFPKKPPRARWRGVGLLALVAAGAGGLFVASRISGKFFEPPRRAAQAVAAGADAGATEELLL